MELFRFYLFRRTKRIKQIYPHNQEILLIFCSTPSKKLETQRRHYLFWHQHKRFQHQQKTIYCCTYTENEEAWPVQMQFAASLSQIQCIPLVFIAVLPINLQYKLDYGCRSRYLPYRLGKNQKLCVGRCWKSLLKSPFFYTRNGSSCHSKEKLMQNSMMKTAKYFDVTETRVSLWGWLTVHTTHECVSRCLHTLHTNAYPGVKRPYSQMHIPSNMG